MTASLWRRLTDLPPRYGEALAAPSAATTEATGLPAADLAERILEVARRLEERVAIVLLSGAQAACLRGDEAAGARILRAVERAATGPTRQRIVDLSYRALVPGMDGEPAAVLLIRDGRIAPDVAQRSRSRGSYRYTLDDDVAEWVREEAARRGTSASDVVQDAIAAARR